MLLHERFNYESKQINQDKNIDLQLYAILHYLRCGVQICHNVFSLILVMGKQ